LQQQIRPRLFHQQAKAFTRCWVVVEAWLISGCRLDQPIAADVSAAAGAGEGDRIIAAIGITKRLIVRKAQIQTWDSTRCLPQRIACPAGC
jgi:hypothetical protein